MSTLVGLVKCHPIVARAPRRPWRHPGPVVEADLDSQGDSGPRMWEPPFVDLLSVPHSTSLIGSKPHRLIPAAAACSDGARRYEVRPSGVQASLPDKGGRHAKQGS